MKAASKWQIKNIKIHSSIALKQVYFCSALIRFSVSYTSDPCSRDRLVYCVSRPGCVVLHVVHGVYLPNKMAPTVGVVDIDLVKVFLTARLADSSYPRFYSFVDSSVDYECVFFLVW